MHALSTIEGRVLGVLVEKALTVPGQYPLSLHALTTGCNQRNNRDPVLQLEEEEVLEALDRLRTRGFVRELMPAGGRVVKYRHLLRDLLELSLAESVTLTELLLRGALTAGEIRTQASRMHTLESIEVVEHVLTTMTQRNPPLVRRLDPAPGTRAARYVQLLAPALHHEQPTAAPPPEPIRPPQAAAGTDLLTRIQALESRVAALESAINAPDPS